MTTPGATVMETTQLRERLKVCEALLLDLDRDIHDWLQLARRQMAEMPNWEYTPYAPTTNGVAGSERLLRRVSAYLQEASHAAAPEMTLVPVMVGTLAQAIAFARLIEDFAHHDGKSLPLDLLECAARSMYTQLRCDVELNRTGPDLVAWEDREERAL